jgi:FixJ family two-component response regulator
VHRLHDADIEMAVKGTIASKYRNAGQTCVCANRILVQDGVYDAFAKRLAETAGTMKVADGFEPGAVIGPLIDMKAVEKVEAHIADARQGGRQSRHRRQARRPGARGRSWVTAKANRPFLLRAYDFRMSRGHDAITLLVAVPLSQRALAMTEQPTVIIVDDDLGIREALGSLIGSVGVQAKALATVPEFLNEGRPDGPTCLVLDVRLPGRSGLDFQRELSAANIHVPIIFITGHGDIPMSVQAIKGGAIEFLTKPFRDQDLLDAIQLGLARDRAWLENEKAIAALRARFDTLTPREREVMAFVVAGRLNKQIAYDIGVSEITVKVHRGQVMRKMMAASLPDLARMADKLNFTAEKSQSC